MLGDRAIRGYVFCSAVDSPRSCPSCQTKFTGESYKVETIYRDFAEQAVDVGDKAASDRFAEIRRDEMKHRDAFKAARARLTGNSTQGALERGEGLARSNGLTSVPICLLPLQV